MIIRIWHRSGINSGECSPRGVMGTLFSPAGRLTSQLGLRAGDHDIAKYCIKKFIRIEELASFREPPPDPHPGPEWSRIRCLGSCVQRSGPQRIYVWDLDSGVFGKGMRYRV